MLIIKRISNSQEKDIAFNIRQKVFVEEQGVDPELEYDEFEDTSTHYLAILNNTPAGTARWRRTEKGIKLERFAVLKSSRGKKIGEALLNTILADLPANEFNKIYLHAQVQVIPFYEKYGFLAQEPLFEEAGIWHKVMVLNAKQ